MFLQRITSGDARSIVEQATRTQMRFPRGTLRIKNLIPVPDLHLRRATQVDAAVSFGDGLVFNQEFDVAKFFDGRRVRAVTVVDQFTVLNGPVLRKLGALGLEIRFPFFTRELRDVVGI